VQASVSIEPKNLRQSLVKWLLFRTS